MYQRYETLFSQTKLYEQARVQIKEVCWQNGFLLEQIQKLMTKLQVRSHDFVVRDVFLGPPIFLHVSCFAFRNKNAPRDNP